MDIRIAISIICIVVAVAVIACALICMKIKDDNAAEISLLQDEIAALKEAQNAAPEKDEKDAEIEQLLSEIRALKYPDAIQYSETGFDYVALGNSVTLHPTCSYWWNVNGMAASTVDKDYVHQVGTKLAGTKTDVHVYPVNYSAWELQNYDRAETFNVLEPYLDVNLDLISIQLGENTKDFTTYERDLEEMIEFIKSKAPNAQIMVIDDFWDAGEHAAMRKTAAENTGVTFISLAEIKGDPEYQAGMGTIVYDAKGKEHKIDHEGVAGHPGDKGMEYIADAIVKAVK